MQLVVNVEGIEYWTLGKIKRVFGVCDHWMLKVVPLGGVRVLTRPGSTHRYSVVDIERLIKEYPPSEKGTGPKRRSVAPVGDAR